MRNPYAKLKLTEADFPFDAETLIIGIQQLVEAILGSITEAAIPGAPLTEGEMLTLGHLLFETGQKREESSIDASLLKNLRQKLAAIDITIPTGNRGHSVASRLPAKTRQHLKRILRENAPTAFYRRALRTILGFSPHHIDEEKLKTKTLPELRTIALKLVNLLRGRTNIISRFAEERDISLSSSRTILLSVIYSQPAGYTSDNRLRMALYTPFTAGPANNEIFGVLMAPINKALGTGPETRIHNAYGIGYYLPPTSRAIIDAYARKPAAASRQPPSQPLLAHTAN